MRQVGVLDSSELWKDYLVFGPVLFCEVSDKVRFIKGLTRASQDRQKKKYADNKETNGI
jgi:hypothetical protein